MLDCTIALIPPIASWFSRWRANIARANPPITMNRNGSVASAAAVSLPEMRNVTASALVNANAVFTALSAAKPSSMRT